MEELDSQSLGSLKKQLLQMEKDLEEQLSISKSAAGVVTLDQTTVGRVSRMDAMQQQSMAVSTREKSSKRLQRVRLALKSMKTGDYGFCKKCDEHISSPRLLAQPEANLCLSCQDQSDRQQ
jgi:DnaK suppressor protein